MQTPTHHDLRNKTVMSMVLPGPKKTGILELLDSKEPLATPPFQRSFAWGLSQVDDYWSDLRRALDADGGPTEYFLGLIVLDDKGHIEDGQQRLATTLLLASEINTAVEAAKTGGNYTEQIAIDAAGAVTPALRQSPNAKLEISPRDQEVLLKRTGIEPDSPESTKRLAKARERLKMHVTADLANKTSADAKLSRLKQWGEYLRDGAYTVLLRVPPRDAHNIFETLNTRGVRLSNGDLVKSHLIGRSSNTTAAVAKWEQVTDSLKDATGRYEDDLESFLLHYFGSQYKETTQSKFFTDYRTEIASVDSLDALDALIKNAKLYRALAAPGSTGPFWASIGSGTGEAIQLLNDLGLRQLRYLLLAVLRDLGKGESASAQRKKQREAVLKITAWSVRGLVDGRTGGGEAMRTYINAATGIRSGSYKTVHKLREYFASRSMFIADDAIFKEKFLIFPWDRANSHKRARAILTALEQQRLGSRTALTPNDTLTIEHVLPRSPEAGQWTHFTPDQRSTYTYNIGNLLLIDGPSGANNTLGNKEWPDKKALIQSWQNQTPLTNDALNNADWNAQVIDTRRLSLANIAARAWRP